MRPAAQSGESGLDEAALARYLDGALGGFRPPFQLRQFDGGQSNPTFLLSTSDRNFVLRKKPVGQLLASAHAIDREYRVLRALAGAGLPIPGVQLYCERDDVIGTPFYIMDHVPGRIFVDPALPGLAAAERRALYDSMNASLAHLHMIDWRGAGLADFGRPERYGERQLERWRRQSKTVDAEPLREMDEAYVWLSANIPDTEVSAIVHGDYRIGNLIFDAQKPRVSAILDWELATIGHPFADLAFNCMAYYFPPGGRLAAGLCGVDCAALGIPTEEEYLEAYARRTGRDPRPEWRFFMTLSLYRAAAIQQGVYARALSGSANSVAASEFGALYRATAALACDKAHGA